MNRFLLVAIFFTFLISFEVAITALATQAFGICMVDTMADGETEKDSKEKSEKDKKVRILLANENDGQRKLLKSLMFSEKSSTSKPYLDQFTPPPEA